MRQMPSFLCVAVLSCVACGTEAEFAATPAQTQSLLPKRVIDLDALQAHPGTQNYVAVASDPNSPCGPFLKDTVALAEVLAPAVAAKNYAAVATHLPQILAAFEELFICAKTQIAARGDTSGAGPQPEAPVVPKYNPLKPCVTVILQGNSSSTCPQ